MASDIENEIDGSQGTEQGDSDEGDPLSTWISILIAVTALVGAWIAWQMTQISNEIGDERSAGINAALNVETTLNANTLSLYKEYRVYTEYLRYQTMASQRADQAQGATENLAAAPLSDATDNDLAAAQLPFFFTRYLTREGTYDRQRYLGEAWAQAQQQIDLDPALHFVQAEMRQDQMGILVAMLIVLAVALLCYTLAEGLHQQRRTLRLTITTLGTAAMIAAIAGSILFTA